MPYDDKVARINSFWKEVSAYGNESFQCFYGLDMVVLNKQYSYSHVLTLMTMVTLIAAVTGIFILIVFCCAFSCILQCRGFRHRSRFRPERNDFRNTLNTMLNQNVDIPLTTMDDAPSTNVVGDDMILTTNVSRSMNTLEVNWNTEINDVQQSNAVGDDMAEVLNDDMQPSKISNDLIASMKSI